MKLDELRALFASMRATRRRTEKIAAVSGLLARAETGELRALVAFLGARPFPASDPRVLDASGALLREAAAAAGAPAAEPSLSIAEVAAAFAEVAAAEGKGSRARKVAALSALFARATADERRLIAGVVFGELRTGFQEGLLVEAIAKALGAPAAAVSRAIAFLADPSEAAAIAKEGGERALAAVEIRLFRPVAPMLAEPAKDLAEAMSGPPVALEWKYDGARVQIHRDADRVRVWSRRMTELTASLPEVVDAARALPADRLILDGEVLAIGADGRPLPFQELMRRLTRVREGSGSAVSLSLVLFDCLYAGAPLVDEPYAARWERLASLAGPHLARRLLPRDAAEAESFLRDALAAGHEGLMAKSLDSRYEPGARGRRWQKVKVPETVDCVVIAVDRGSGKREGWLSNYHLAVRDGKGGFAHVGKTFKGLTDAELAAMTERFRALAIADDGYTVTLRPEVVVEVTYNDVQKSPRRSGGRARPPVGGRPEGEARPRPEISSSGFALRFARVTRIRDDKGPADATTLDELRERYEKQFASKARPA